MSQYGVKLIWDIDQRLHDLSTHIQILGKTLSLTDCQSKIIFLNFLIGAIAEY